MAQNNSFGSFIKILVGIGLAVLIFMSYMLAEQRGWVNTDIAGRLLRGVEDGKTLRDEQAQKPAASNSDKKIFGETVPAKQTETPKSEPTSAPAKQETPADNGNDEADFDDDGFDSDEDADDSADTSSDEDTAEKTPETPEVKTVEKPKKPAKLDYTEVSRKRSTWPKAVQMRVKGTRVPMLNQNGAKIGEIEVPVGTRLFVLKVTDRGVLEVKSAVNGQIFQVHASRTTFSRLYTGKPISDGLRSSSSTSSSSTPASDDDSGDADDSEDSDSGDDSSDDNFSDDDFFDDDF